MSRAEFVINDQGCYLQVNGEKVENIQINSHQGKVDRGSITEQYDLQKGLYQYREPICTLNFTAEFKNCQQSDVKYEIPTLYARDIAKLIEESFLEAVKVFASPKQVTMPRRYWDTLVSFYGFQSNLCYTSQYTMMPEKRTWRGLEVLEGKEIKVI